MRRIFVRLGVAEAGLAHVAGELGGAVQVGAGGEVEEQPERRRRGALARGVGAEHVEHGDRPPGFSAARTRRSSATICSPERWWMMSNTSAPS